MNLRCTYCQTPFAIGRLEKLAAIQKMQAEDLHHYDVFCPRCRRANSVSRQRLEIFTPGWQEGLKTLEAEATQIEKERQAPVPAASVEAKPAAAETTRRRHSPRPEPAAPTKAASTPKAKKTPSKAAPATKSKADAKKPAAKPAPKGKPAAKKSTAKPAAKKTVKKK
jgi:hypothetical protein